MIFNIEYLILPLFLIFLLVLGTIFWLLLLKRKYQKREIFEKKIKETKIEKSEEKKEESLSPLLKTEKEKTLETKKILDINKNLEETSEKEITTTISGFKTKIERLYNDFLEEQKSQLGQINKEIKKLYSDLFEEISNEKKEIKNELQEILEKEILKYQKEALETKRYLNKKIEEYLEGFLKEINESLKEEVKNNLQLAQREIENYKKEKLKEIDEKIYQITLDVFEKIGGKMIDFSTHEKLIFEALEKAKAKNLFFD